MDMDTTKRKNSHEQILSAFSDGEADILVGTQMIVKGHDFANVTLVGVLAADLSLHANDYRAGERTFQLLTQAAGRAGRGDKPEVVIRHIPRTLQYPDCSQTGLSRILQRRDQLPKLDEISTRMADVGRICIRRR